MKQKIIELSKKHDLSHIGSCLSSYNGIEAVYNVKKTNEKFILSNGHAGLALYCVLEDKFGINAEQLLKYGIHPNRLSVIVNDGMVSTPIDCSTGSLGMGLTVAVGMALANRNKNVYCMISDGEMSEGCIWESLRIVSENKLINLKLLLNANGWGAYKKINTDELIPRFQSFGWAVSKCKNKVSDIEKSLNIDIDFPIVTFIETNSNFEQVKGLDCHYVKL